MPVVCACGTVADEGDLECSLCGRDLSSLHSRARPHPSIGYSTHQTAVVGQHDHSYADPPAFPDSGLQPPTYPWALPRTESVAVEGTYRGGAVAAIVIGALVLAIAGFALGYLVIAGFLPADLASVWEKGIQTLRL
jgi:hypothetical protein